MRRLANEIDDELIARARRTFETLIGAWRDARSSQASQADSHYTRQEQAA